MSDTLEVINKYLIDMSEEEDEEKKEEKKESMIEYIKSSEDELSLRVLTGLFSVENKIEKYIENNPLNQRESEFMNELKEDITNVTEHFKMFNLARRLPKK